MLAASAAVLPATVAARQLRGLQTGFTDDALFASSSPLTRAAWLGRAASEHASTVRLNASWAKIAPQAPPSAAEARNPSWQGYDFSELDGAVVSAHEAGLRVLITVSTAPSWAERHRPSSATAGSWMPRPAAFASFATAIAKRYSGSFVPSPASAPLPRVRWWQAWNEPNLSIYLAPQWRRHGKRWIAESPSLYRKMLDAFYEAVHRVGRGERVLTAGTAPYGDPPGGQRMPPAMFVRSLLCLTQRLKATRCPRHADFDVLDHHPYSVEGPFFHAFNRDDVAIADMGKLIRPLRAAERLHLVGGPKRHAVWVTEVSWDSSPPDPQGVPARKQALWLQQTFYLLWKQGVSTVLWYLIGDAPPIPSYASTYQSGTYLLNGSPKPSAAAFRFPFVLVGDGARAKAARRRRRARLSSSASVLLWGKSPDGGAPVSVQRRSKGRWHTIATTKPGRSGVFEASVSSVPGRSLRAKAGGEHSLSLRP